MQYKVILNDTLKTTVDYCDCKYCQGHYRKEEIRFDKLIEADSQQDAKAQAIELIQEDYDIGKSDLLKAPFVILEPGEKLLTRKAELDLLERWNKGLGLPAFQLQYEYTYEVES